MVHPPPPPAQTKETTGIKGTSIMHNLLNVGWISKIKATYQGQSTRKILYTIENDGKARHK